MDMSLSKLQEIVKDREAWCCCSLEEPWTMNERGTRRTKWFWETLQLTVCLFHNVWEMLIKDHFILKSWLLEFLPWMLVPLWDGRMWILVSLRRYGRGALPVWGRGADGGPEMLHFIPVLDWHYCASEVCFSLTVRSRAQVAGLETLEQWPNLKIWSTKSCKLRDNVLVCVH